MAPKMQSANAVNVDSATNAFGTPSTAERSAGSEGDRDSSRCLVSGLANGWSPDVGGAGQVRRRVPCHWSVAAASRAGRRCATIHRVGTTWTPARLSNRPRGSEHGVEVGEMRGREHLQALAVLLGDPGVSVTVSPW
jgi:hypothetical protein